MSRLKPWQKVLLVISLLGSLAIGLLGFGVWNLGRSHKHCIEGVGGTLSSYAAAHGGQYPSHKNGFGDALGLLAIEDPEWAIALVGVDDNADWLMAAATNRTDVPEERCTRIYVQGLSEKSNPEIAILFDRFAVRGGDHLRAPWRPYTREVWRGYGMQWVTLDRWPAFASNQVELLVKEGIPRATAEAYYRPTLDPNAKR